MKQDKVALLFEDLSINSSYQFLEEGKDSEILREIAAKRGISLPSKDIAIFKGKYAFVDEQNRNKCTLPRKEVKKALKTIVGKAIDKDHLRKQTIGFWVDSELDEDTIYSYGAFWKSNFPDDYEEIKKRMAEGKLKISFEAWGDRTFKEDGSYDLTNIEFAGGALLFDTEPAFPNAEVVEMASNRVLEFAKVLEGGLKIEEYIEEARLDFFGDSNQIARVVFESECPTCSAHVMLDIEKIDFVNSKITHKCMNCNSVCETDLTPTMVLKKKGKLPKPESPMSDDGKISLADKGTTKVEPKNEEGGNVVDELLKKYSKSSVEELTKFIDELQIAQTAKDQEIATLKKSLEDSTLMVENAKIEIEKFQVEAKAVKEQLDARLIAEKAAAVKARKDELGEEFAKDLSDEDIMHDLKFENAKLKKELALAKQEKPKDKVESAGLEAGAKEVKKDTPAFEKQKSIQEKAWKD